MKKVLHIFDSKQLLYGGVMKKDIMLSNGVIEGDGPYRDNSVSVGTISYALNELYRVIGKGDVILCHDSAPTIKRELMGSLYCGLQYKGNRTVSSYNESIPFMFKWFKEIISAVKYPHIIVEGYEADDIIYSVVKRYRSSYDEILIHSNDNDQYALVDDVVKCVPVTAKGKLVTVESYSKMCKKDVYTPYNSIFLYKLVEGDVQHNNIPRIPEKYRSKILESVPMSTHKYLGNMDLLRTIVLNAVRGDSVVMGNLDLILPLSVPYDEVTLESWDTNWSLFNYFADRFLCKSFMEDRRYMGLGDFDVVDETGDGEILINKLFMDKERKGMT